MAKDQQKSQQPTKGTQISDLPENATPSNADNVKGGMLPRDGRGGTKMTYTGDEIDQQTGD